jgi:YVTN family beta-propeller protein
MHHRLRSSVCALAILCLAASVASAEDHVYVPSGDALSSTVAVVAPGSNTSVATIASGTGPRGIAISPDRAYAYVANEYTNDVSVISTASKVTVATIPVGQNPFGIAVSPSGARVYVTNITSNTVSVIDTATRTVVATVPIPGPPSLGAGPRGVAVDPTSSRVYVANWLARTVTVIDATTNTVIASVVTPSQLVHLAVNPAGTRLYVSGWPIGPSSIFVVDTASLAIVGTISVNTVESISVSPDGARLYLPNRFDNFVTVVDTATNTVTANIPIAGPGIAASLNASGSKLYVLNSTQNVQAIDTATYAVSSTSALVPPGSFAFGNSFVVENPEPCLGFSVAPANLVFPQFGGTQGLQIFAPPTCKWRISGGAFWLSVTPVGGIGSATVNVTAAPNNRQQRGAVLTVTGTGVAQNVGVFQF